MYSINGKSEGYACNCIGPQRGQPYCPCVMRSLIIINGRYYKDMGPVKDDKHVDEIDKKWKIWVKENVS